MGIHRWLWDLVIRQTWVHRSYAHEGLVVICSRRRCRGHVAGWTRHCRGQATGWTWHTVKSLAKSMRKDWRVASEQLCCRRNQFPFRRLVAARRWRPAWTWVFPLAWLCSSCSPRPNAKIHYDGMCLSHFGRGQREDDP